MKNKKMLITLICISIIILIVVALNTIKTNYPNISQTNEKFFLDLTGGTPHVQVHCYIYNNNVNNMKYKYVITHTYINDIGTDAKTREDYSGYSNSMNEIFEIAEKEGCAYSTSSGKDQSIEELKKIYND